MIVTFGEIMMRLSPPNYQRISQAHNFDIFFGGGEANVAVSLAGFGMDSRFVTKLPDNDIGRACKGDLARWDIDTSAIVLGGERIGIYFCEKGASQRPSKVIYDRTYSSFATADISDFDWDNILEKAEWFHFTGITPALSDNTSEIILKACQVAKKKGIPVSCDLNYRKKLWSKCKAKNVMTYLMQYVDVLIANEEDAADVFDIHAETSDVNKGEINRKEYESIAKQLMEKFHFKKVAITLRESLSASHNNWSALLYDGNNIYVSKKYSIEIVDRIGGGDSFAAGLIFGITQGYHDNEALEFTVAASCLKHSIEGDFNLVTVEEVKALVDGDGSGRVLR